MENDALSRRAFLGAGTAGAAAAGTAGTATAQDGTETETETGTAAAQGGETHTVAMTDDLIYDPEALTIAPGDTVVWENVGEIGHSITAYEEEIPEEAEYWASGGFDNEQGARDNYPDQGDVGGGGTYEHTFEVEGDHEYFCIPHEQVGMLGTITVTTEPQEPAGPTGPAVPDSAKTLIVATTFAMMATLLLAYFFLKFGGDSPSIENE
jgi:plastocyanin